MNTINPKEKQSLKQNKLSVVSDIQLEDLPTLEETKKYGNRVYHPRQQIIAREKSGVIPTYN